MKWFRKTLLSKNFWLGRRSYKVYDPSTTVTVVIPAWNEEASIAKTIGSIRVQTHRCRIIVVDDCSTDRTSEIASQFDGVEVLRSPINQGSKARALNCALPYIDSDIFVCVDADTMLEPDAIEKLIAAFDDDEVAIACGSVMSTPGQNFWQMARLGEYLVSGALSKSAQANASCVMVAAGCFFAIRTSFLKQHGFDHRTMAEDMDLTWKAIEAGHEIAYVPTAYSHVVDPHNRAMYTRQMARWHRGYFQCLQARGYNLFGSLRLAIPAYGYGLALIVGLPLQAMAVTMFPYESMLFMMMMFVGLSIFMTCLNYKHGIALVDGPAQTICMMMIAYVNYFIFMKSAWLEIVQKKRLVTWDKGH